MKLALFDMGSNSIRLLLGEYSDGQWHNESKRIWTTRLGQRDEKGLLTDIAQQATLEALQEGLTLAKAYGATEWKALATSAMREAPNGQEFAREIEGKLGIKVSIITGEEEACFGFIGAVQDFAQKTDSLQVVFDIGGASTEIAIGTYSAMKELKSYPIGAVRMQSMSLVNSTLVDESCQPYWSQSNLNGTTQCIGIGGTFTTLAAMDLKLSTYDPKKVHGHCITRTWVCYMQTYLRTLSYEELKVLPGLHPKRVDIIIAGIDIVASLMHYYDITEIRVSEKDGLEGAQAHLVSSLRTGEKVNLEVEKLQFSKTLEETVYKTILEYSMIEAGDKVLVACSGGPDSMALLHMLSKWRDKLSFSLGAICIDHRIRLQGWAESELVRKYAAEHDIEFFGYSDDVPYLSYTEKISMETAGRQVRYHHFSELTEKYGYNKIALGHHKDDQSETVLAHIIRGTGLTGLKGMEYTCQNKIRPLLKVTKKDLLQYVTVNAIAYAWDHTNDELAYERNKLRLAVIPFLKEFNPAVVDALCRLAEIATMDDSYLEHISENILSSYIIEKEYIDEEHLDCKQTSLKPLLKRVILDRLGFAREDKAIRYRMWRQLASLFMPFGVTPTWENILSMDSLLFKKEHKQFSLKWMKIHVQYDRIYITQSFFEKKDGACTISPFYEGSYTPVVKTILKCPSECEKGTFIIPKIVADKGLIIRTRQDGDVIILCNKVCQQIGHKKLKKYLIDKKIPVEERNRMFWLVAGNEVLCEAKKDQKFILKRDEDEEYVVGYF